MEASTAQEGAISGGGIVDSIDSERGFSRSFQLWDACIDQTVQPCMCCYHSIIVHDCI